MNFPTSTYRLQFRNGMDFEEACSLVPYLAELGISHLYASPIFTAASDSTHGYDVTDYNEIDPVLGGRDGFDRLVQTLREHRIGLILDIVPNHMAASPENPWWNDVLRQGEASPHARHFDVDWSRPITLPVLGQPLEAVLADGELHLERDATGTGHIAYFDQLFPLSPERAAHAHAVDIKELLAEQHYELMHWKEARRTLSYRRFFEVTGLIGVRVEEEETFRESHRLALDLLHGGQIDGLRIDHVDGLADPTAYLKRLRSAIGPDAYLVVEKILAGDEQLPAEWPVDGTTGYEFIPAMTRLFTDAEGAHALSDAFGQLTGVPFNESEALREIRLRMITHNFEGETTTLVDIATEHLGKQREPLQRAVEELLCAAPVYRTYVTAQELTPKDRAIIDTMIGAAARHADQSHVDAVASLLLSDGSDVFRTRFQQLTGPIMAKSVEDTLFYRDVRFLAGNEVGGHAADAYDTSSAGAHERLARLVEHQPRGMRATATHDTKRGEDARARLYVLSEFATEFEQLARAWCRQDAALPPLDVQWLVLQSLVGLWPRLDAPLADVADLQKRLGPYLTKALREAKSDTNWLEPDLTFEKKAQDFLDDLLFERSGRFAEDMRAFMSALDAAAWLTSLAQTAIKLMLPGVPDIYQGTELFDDSLVDPDNRRPIPFEKIQHLNRSTPLTWQNWLQPNAKSIIIKSLLSLRTETLPATYRALASKGTLEQHCFAFATRLEESDVIVAVPRHAGSLLDGKLIPPEIWQDTVLKTGLEGGFRNLLTRRRVSLKGDITLTRLFQDGPIVVLSSDK
ncbi:malto-oligosyltrehalose synthase [Rhizobium albus]|nr:malto-oligosyltrehalose synthase [Rhizobium albus]